MPNPEEGFGFFVARVMLVETQMPQTFQTKLSGEDVGKILAKLSEHDARFDKQDKELECIQVGINGTAQEKGLAGDVRDYKAWRLDLEGTPGTGGYKPLSLQLAEIRAWQNVVTRALFIFGVPIALTILMGALTLLWLLVTNRAELVIH